jgi:hypothetical protein
MRGSSPARTVKWEGYHRTREVGCAWGHIGLCVGAHR